MDEISLGDLQEKSFRLGTVFKPSAPINREDLFAGRTPQTRDVLDTIAQQGQHAVLYGERGVGKTSLANIISSRLRVREPGVAVLAPLVNCMTADTYSDIWRRVFEEVAFQAQNRRAPITLERQERKLLKEYTGSFSDNISPDVVRRILSGLGAHGLVVVILDEFDTVAGPETRAMMSDTLKFLSDRAVPVTVVLVGVADDVETLVANHRSLERCLRQIRMPRMSYRELEAIVNKGLDTVGMTIEPSALDEISHLSRGLPHYPHLLGLDGGRAALDGRSLCVRDSHIRLAIKEAVQDAQATIRADYSKAITSSRREALYKEVLLACALAETDDLGWFYPRDVRAPLEKIFGHEYKISAFSRHLQAFLETEHGPVLVKDNRSARPRYRFDNPLMQPYVLIRGLAASMITNADIKSMKERLTAGLGELF
jgi:Cdc6-like AAA superfamily ATPase